MVKSSKGQDRLGYRSIFNEPDIVLKDIEYSVYDDPGDAKDFRGARDPQGSLPPANLNEVVFENVVDLMVTVDRDNDQGLEGYDTTIKISGTLGKILLDIYNFYSDKHTNYRAFEGLRKVRPHRYVLILGVE